MKYTSLLLLIFITQIFSSYASTEIEKSKTSQGRSELLKELKEELSKKDTLHDMLLLPKYIKHSSEMVRWDTCSLLVEEATKKKNNYLKRREVLQCLSERLVDDESTLVKQSSVKWMLNFKSRDFNERTKNIIKGEYQKYRSKELILLAGLAKIKSLQHEIQEISKRELNEPGAGRYYGTDVWAALIVTAKYGNEESVDRLIRSIRNEKEAHVKVALLLKELEGIQSTKIVLFLNEFLSSDERLESVKSTVLGTQYAQHAAIVLSKMLDGFPVTKESANYSGEELNICRQWMSNQTEWLFKD